MKSNQTLQKIIVYGLLVIIVLFNLYLYRSEFTVLSDPNDNVFHAALVDEARNIWSQIFTPPRSPNGHLGGVRGLFYLLDSWNERWAEGFALSTYYAHLPQALISLVSFILPISAFKLFVYVRTLLLILLPIPFFLAGTILRLPSAYSLILAFLSHVIFTDGLYGIDSSSFLWRGWGLSAQLIGIFFLPLAFAYAIDYLKNGKNLGKAIIFNFIVGQSHFGVLFLLLLGYPIYWLFFIENNSEARYRFFDRLTPKGPQAIVSKRYLRFLSSLNLKGSLEVLKRTFVFLALTFLSLAYFILPFFWLGKYRNFSYWDQIWKFDSWGLKQVIIWFTNGDLFDFNRFPLITLLLFGGLLAGLVSEKKVIRYLTILFGFYFVLFFGRRTFGSLIDIIPGFSEYHIHRVIIMVQFTGIFVAGWFLYGLTEKVLQCVFSIKNARYRVSNFNRNTPSKLIGLLEKVWKQVSSLSQYIFITVIIVIASGLIYFLEKPVIKYAKDNQSMIIGSNQKYRQEVVDYQKIIDRLAKMPKARVYAGRPGNWGREFKIADTQVYMALSQDGFPTLGFLPQSWSPNSDPEQFFNEDDLDFYNLYQVGYIVYPVDKKPPKFAKFIGKAGKYALYKIDTNGWFSFGNSDLIVSGKKTNFVNIVKLWLESGWMKAGDYPEISFSTKTSATKNTISMVDLNRYRTSDFGLATKELSLWQQNPFLTQKSTGQLPGWKKLGESVLVNGYQASFQLSENCSDCIVILKQSFHPGWQVKVNGKRVESFPIFPFFIGIPLEKAGSYSIDAVYQPSGWKIGLIFIGITTFAVIFLKYPKL